jgi:MFS-type transporter involved in bile tolerance (Atg22 family)
MSEVVDKNKMGYYMGMFNLSIVIPQLLVSIAVGLIVEGSSDKNIVFLISGFSLAISSFLWLLVKEQKK